MKDVVKDAWNLFLVDLALSIMLVPHVCRLNILILFLSPSTLRARKITEV